ncbi:MAG TPA: sugar ABC transporter ATP-binding protein [Phycisphaerae bacterium]|nr:sugar ABC transporter ATP-binding protein [Phycisphaerae bacterium]HNU44267.1 sugar ABC transporter ATP-binding protein [Phycisphaerae bacterium]
MVVSPRLEMLGVGKRFGATVALADVSLVVQPGEVHALVGENGAGKSTLMKVLSGAVRPDAGRMRLDGQAFTPASPLAARAAGVAMIYQEFNLAPHLSVEENITLGAEQRSAGFVRRAAHRRRMAAIFSLLDRPDLRLDVPVRCLSAADRQLVEIARALLADAHVLVMDEPTSSLGLADIERLFAVIERLRAEGVTIVYISHFLEEVQRVAQRYTVLRDGRNAGTGAMADVALNDLVELMIGRRLHEMFPRVPHEVGVPILEIRGLAGRRQPCAADLTLHRGEILGLAGLVGAGRTELLRCIYGLDAVRAGTVRIGAYTAGPGARGVHLAQGVGLLSEDRQAEGLLLSRSVADNVTLSRLGPLARWGWINLRAVQRATTEWMRRLDIRARSADQRLRDLSGGNQQKTALARLLHHGVDVLLLDEPTRGIDVASKAQIYQLIGELAAGGKAVLMASSYLPELLGVCDRIAVMHRGRLGRARPREEWTEHALISAAASGKETAA